MADTLDRLTGALADRSAIQEELGAGGMATVYLAEDLKHHRKVAVKVLRPELAAILGAERFLKEIEVTANLQHPHILPLFDSGEAGGEGGRGMPRPFLYYVMPYNEGETLRDKLNREKQLAVEETIEIAKSVAGALSFAHASGVIHRDIKPENILLQNGQPVVADFGIALAVTAAGGTRLTETGLSLGTPQYMSPEQATGDRVDARSDIYSLGALLYEMLVGEPPHVGNSVQVILAKVISETPTPIRVLRELVPVNVDAAVRKALSKVAADRFATATQFVEAITNPSFALPTETPAVPARLASPALKYVWPVAFGIVSLLAAWGWLKTAAGPAGAPQVTRLVLPLLEGRSLAVTGGQTKPMDISPDGSRLVYVAEQGRETRLYLQNLGESEARALPGTEGAVQPFFSPDGEWVGFNEVAAGPCNRRRPGYHCRCFFSFAQGKSVRCALGSRRYHYLQRAGAEPLARLRVGRCSRRDSDLPDQLG